MSKNANSAAPRIPGAISGMKVPGRRDMSWVVGSVAEYGSVLAGSV
jgi:hypothetical protein